MNTFLKRTLTASVFVVVMLTGVLWNKISYFALFNFITFGCLWEFYQLVNIHFRNKNSAPLNPYLPVITGTGIFILSIFSALNLLPFTLLWITIPLLSLFFIFRLYSSQGTFEHTAFSVLGIVYIALPFSLLNFITIQEGQYSYQMVLGILLLVWTNDTMAYIIGSLIGRHKLLERISPKKTWEGTTGGIVCCMLAGWLISAYFTDFTRTDWLVIGAITGVFGTWGDLIESMLKRTVGVKDSGSIMPGHGGFLDRFDAFLFSIPFIFAYLHVFKTLIMQAL